MIYIHIHIHIYMYTYIHIYYRREPPSVVHPRQSLPVVPILQVDGSPVELQVPVDCKLGDARGGVQQPVALGEKERVNQHFLYK